MSESYEAAASAPMEGKRPNAVRRLYDWVVSWAESPYGLLALFLIAFAESSVFPIPPDVLLLALAFGAPRKSFKFALVCAAGSILGALGGYLIGVFFFDSVGQWVIHTYGLEEKVLQVREYYSQNAFMYLVIAGFTPIPFKVFTIISGAMRIPIATLVVASALSRTARFMMVAGCVFFMGNKAKAFIDRWFDTLTVVFTVLLIGGFVLLKYLH